MTHRRRTFNEQIAMARGSRVPLGEDHRCSRFWCARFQCPFHGVEPEDDMDQEDPERDEPQKTLSRSLRAAETPRVADVADAVPVVAKLKTGPDLLRAKAEVESTQIDIPAPPDPPPGRGIPLMIPDENIPEFTPPGMDLEAEAVGATSEEALVEFLKEGSKARVVEKNEAVGATAASDNEDEVGSPQFAPAEVGGNPLFETLAASFIAAITATFFTHLAQNFNKALLPGGSPFKPPSGLGLFEFKEGRQGGGFLGGKPVTGAGAGGYFFESLPGEVDFRNVESNVESQEDFNQRFKQAVEGGEHDVD